MQWSEVLIFHLSMPMPWLQLAPDVLDKFSIETIGHASPHKVVRAGGMILCAKMASRGSFFRLHWIHGKILVDVLWSQSETVRFGHVRFCVPSIV